MHLSGVRPSVRLSHPTVADAVGSADRNYRSTALLLHGRRANAGSATLSAYGVVKHRLVKILF